MISMDDAEYPREYRTLGSGPRRFSNVGLVHTSERRHTVVAAQSLEALSGLPKADADRRRDVLMDHIKSKYPVQHTTSPSPSHGSARGSTERPREQQQPNYWSFKTYVTYLLGNTPSQASVICQSGLNHPGTTPIASSINCLY
ncbi:SRC kinase signaling inhibitor 1-like [Arapaima gigas]